MYFKVEQDNDQYHVSHRSMDHFDWEDSGSLQDWTIDLGYVRESRDDKLTVFHRLNKATSGHQNLRSESWSEGISYEALKKETENLKEISEFHATQNFMEDMKPITELVPKGIKGHLKHWFTPKAKKEEQHREVMARIEENCHNSTIEYVQSGTDNDHNILVNGDAIDSIEDKGVYRVMMLSEDFSPYNKIKTRLTVDDLLATFDNLSPNVVKTNTAEENAAATQRSHVTPALGKKLNNKR